MSRTDAPVIARRERPLARRGRRGAPQAVRPKEKVDFAAAVPAANVQPIAAGAPASDRVKLAWPVVALCWSLIIPWIIPLGSLAMPPYRIVLIITFFPAMFRILSGKAGRIGVADIAIVLFSFWISVALIVAHGFGDAIEQAGSETLETMGAFMVARAYIRSVRDFEALARLMFIIVGFVLFPLALLEAALGRNIVLELASRVFPTHIINYQPPRMGIRRVQSVFEHPILFGVFCSGVLATTYLVLGHGKTTAKRLGSTAIIALTAFLSLSSGPISTVIMQIALLTWNRLLGGLKSRWCLLICGFGGLVLIVDLISSRPLPAILFSYFALDEASAYFRLLIWEFGSQSVMNHPIFGVGMGQWDRPEWMPFSVDMFWLVNAIVGGIPAAFFMAVAFFSTVLSVAFAKGLDARAERCRLAFLIAMAGFFVVGWMVHFWGATYVFFILMLGSGRWMVDLVDDRSRKGNRPAEDGATR